MSALQEDLVEAVDEVPEFSCGVGGQHGDRLVQAIARPVHAAADAGVLCRPSTARTAALARPDNPGTSR
ncbi:hypothetical protein [Winogradskya humida]|uniref:hypothetical protein n=1 Tax=Winogradskya humida TaxID=113566 RepID=UPI001941F26C|nr:hypothetical protein [Actinoplanes humidus]